MQKLSIFLYLPKYKLNKTIIFHISTENSVNHDSACFLFSLLKNNVTLANNNNLSLDRGIYRKNI